MEKVSVIIPHARETFLRESILSVKRQSYPEIETVLIENKGESMGTGFNRGLRASTGSYVFFLSDVDTLDPLTIASLMRAIDGVENATCYCTLIDEKGNIVGYLRGVRPGLWEKSAIEELGGFSEEMKTDTDTDLMKRANEARMRQRIIKRYYYRHRLLHDGQNVDNMPFRNMVLENYRKGKIRVYRSVS